jgi:integrase
MRAGELLALQWGDFNWPRRFVQVQRNLVRGVLTTPKNHQRRRVDLSYQLTAALRLWRRQQRAAWLAVGRSFPEWVFASVNGTALDESNVAQSHPRRRRRASSRTASDAPHVCVVAAAGGRADHVREPATRPS